MILAAAPLLLCAALWLADKLWPLPLYEVQPARVVVAQDGTPLWRFADKNGIWRYPVTIEDVSPRYLEALLNYEDRWFWRHPGINPLAIARAAWQDLRSGSVVSGGSTLTMQVARCWTRIRAPSAASCGRCGAQCSSNGISQKRTFSRST